ncbi:hypothetical protein DKX38_028614 [Salix brachista]|uniref:Glutaredoxin domain-containing protein n=1 Tax=Salix brachista TaxID=2182728 RepID=A0A5N5J623_9ROSI|nr:hypothetical protein DKX38_028614 [Salix brachista]
MATRMRLPSILATAATLAVLAASLSWASGSPEATFVKKTISSHKIVIFSKSYCPYCKKAKGVFKELNQTPHVVELDQRIMTRELKKMVGPVFAEDGQNIQDAMSEIAGRRTVPQVFIDGKHIDTVEAYQSGELAKLLGIASEQKDDL